MTWFLISDTVSYTHLDVYKRQGFQIGEWYHAVAHLDDAVSLAGVAQK